MSLACYFVLVFFRPFSIAITSLGEERERANLSAFRTFVPFAFVWFCLFSLPLRVWDGLQLVIVALPGLFSYPFWPVAVQLSTIGFLKLKVGVKVSNNTRLCLS